MSIKAAIYCRVSTLEQTETKNDQSSHDTQEQVCRAWISERGFKTYDVYTDTKSGRNLDRPELQRLLNDAESGKIDLIVTSRLDRISRSVKDFHNLIEDLNGWGVEISFATESIDTTTLMGETMRNMLMVFAQFESDMNSKRTKEQRANAIKNGYWMGGHIPLGYDRINNKLIVNDEETDAVNYIFDLYLEHKSVPQIRRILNNQGYRNKEWITKEGKTRGGSKFTLNSLYSILKRRLYIGEFEYEGNYFETKFEAIVEKEKFQKAQQIRSANDNNSKKYSKGNSPNLLEGIINCGLCDYSMTPTYTKKSDKKYYYYKCVKKNKQGKSTDHNPKSLPYDKVDNFVISTLKVFLEQPQLLKAFKKRVEFNAEDRIDELNSKLRAVQNNRNRIETEIDQTMNTILDNPSNKELWEERLTKYKSQRDDLDSEIKSIKEELDQIKNSRIIDDSSHKEIIKEFNQEFKNRTLDQQKELVQTLIRDVESTVQNKDGSYTGEGEIIISYVCDEFLEAEWQEIKKCETNKPKNLSVRTSLCDGSPGRIRTYDRSVNSRLLCH